MKRIKNFLFSPTVLILLAIHGCTVIENTPVPEGNTVTSEGNVPLRITIGLKGNDPDTKLIYEETSINGRNGMKTLWSEGDVITANAIPSSKNNAYVFNLVEGHNTSLGVFECTTYPNGYAPENYNTNAWTLYFPGDRIKEEADYLKFSYKGQTQTGNNNMEHLKDFHTIRLYKGTGNYGDRIPFNDGFIDFTREEEIEESGCMKFNLRNLPSGIVPTKIELTYYNPSGKPECVFYLNNHLNSYYGPFAPKQLMHSSVSLNLEGFGETSSITAYMMLSNGEIEISNGGKFKVTVAAEDGNQYFCKKPINSNITMKGGKLHSITCTSWTKIARNPDAMDNVDGFENPEDGIVVLQEATKGTGVDIFIMGDGFAATKKNFGANGLYDDVMRQAYENFFSIEPYRTLKPYFNVYYIKAVSKEDHDAVPDQWNGATQGSAETVFSTQFRAGTTSVSGNDNMVFEYASQIVREKGGRGGTPVSDETEIYNRAHTGLSMVMVNVKCYAGTCSIYYNSINDYCFAPSVAYTPLGLDDADCRWTTIHEAGGHGFGKLSDEYSGTPFSGSQYDNDQWFGMENYHSVGMSRNVDVYYIETYKWTISGGWPYTTEENVYWTELLGSSYTYKNSESFGIYEGGNTYNDMFCRPTPNSVMRSQFGENGQFFNAISRWAIWYRVMRLSNSISTTQFKDSLDEFIAFDSTLDIVTNQPLTRSAGISYENMAPLAPPRLIEGRWENGRFIVAE